MTSRGTPHFWAAYRGLPSEIRDAAQKAYKLFRENPQHPGLQFKKVHIFLRIRDGAERLACRPSSVDRHDVSGHVRGRIGA